MGDLIFNSTQAVHRLATIWFTLSPLNVNLRQYCDVFIKSSHSDSERKYLRLSDSHFYQTEADLQADNIGDRNQHPK